MAAMPMPDRLQTADDRIGDRDLTTWRSGLGRRLLSLFAALNRALRPVAGRVASWSSAHLAFVVFAAAALVAMVALVAGSEQVYESVTEGDGVAGLDEPVLDTMVGLRSPGLNGAVTVFTDIGGPIGMPVLATVAVVAIAVWRRRWTPVVLTVIAAAGSLAMTVVGSSRPLRRGSAPSPSPSGQPSSCSWDSHGSTSGTTG
jgi:hypothetical protein